ncbi:HAD family hydrolase [Tissierella creatinini]|nr:HAD family hydrolase [Tissierella creatinini]TJX60972.1 HAD family hydrolase [Soehngenia saccharolytica]
MSLYKTKKVENLDSIIFDLDGTLWDSTKEILKSWNEALDKYDEVTRKFTIEDIEGFMGTPIDKIFKSFLSYLDEDKIREIERKCNINEIEYIEAHGGNLYPGLENVLNELSAKYKLAIVSNCQDGYIEAFIKYNGFERYFTDFEYIGRTGLPKSENIKLVIERNNFKNSIYLGDTEGDRKAARLSGISFIYAKYGFGQVNEYDYKIDRIEELLELV